MRGVACNSMRRGIYNPFNATKSSAVLVEVPNLRMHAVPDRGRLVTALRRACNLRCLNMASSDALTHSEFCVKNHAEYMHSMHMQS